MHSKLHHISLEESKFHLNVTLKIRQLSVLTSCVYSDRMGSFIIWFKKKLRLQSIKALQYSDIPSTYQETVKYKDSKD